MKLLYVFVAILAFTYAEEDQNIEDQEAAAANVELFREGADLKAEANSYPYVPPSQRPPQWTAPYVPPQNTWNPPAEPVKPWVPPVQSDYVPQPYPTYPPVQQTWTPHYHPSTTTTPVSVIKNDQYYGDNGSYKYEYQIADGTHVAEEGYFTDPKGTDESIVKKGFYSYVGADGKTYTVTYWADKTGFHAFGDHLPTPPPVPAAIQAALDKENATPAPAVYPTQAPVYYPPVQKPQPTPQPVHPPYPTYPTYPNYPTSQPIYVQPQPGYYPPQNTYPQQQPTYG